MRKKALLIGARASYQGPWVNLEEGEWLVEPPRSGFASIYIEGRGDDENYPIVIDGPARVRATVIEGNSVCLDAKQVA